MIYTFQTWRSKSPTTLSLTLSRIILIEVHIITLLLTGAPKKRIPNGHVEQPLSSLARRGPCVPCGSTHFPTLVLSKTTTKLISALKFEQIRVCPQFYVWLSPKACQTTRRPWIFQNWGYKSPLLITLWIILIYEV